MSAIALPERHNPKAWANYGCKDSEFLGDMQIKITLEVIFMVEGVKKYGVEVGSCAKRSLKFKV